MTTATRSDPFALRPYQEAARRAIHAGFREFDRQLVVMPTGSGKTRIFAQLAADFQPARTLILAHREELLDQAVDKLRAATGIESDVEMADRWASHHAPVVVASVQTLMRQSRRDRWPENHFRLVVADEAHRAISPSWQSVLSRFHDHAQVIGLSATPDRGDKRNLGVYFQNIAFEISLLDLVRDGWLCPIRVKTVPLGIDLRRVRSTAGDYNADDLGDALGPWLDRIADVLVAHRDRKTLVFLPLISVSQDFAQRCRQRGLAAEHVDGDSRDRAMILNRFSSNEIRLLCNAMLLSEGYDEPTIDCVVNLRPTKIRSLFAQQVGRGTRIHPGKDHLLLLDFLFQAGEHKLIRPAHLVAADESQAQQITAALEDEEDLEEALRNAEAERMRSLAARLRANRHRPSTEVDALELAVALNENALADFIPEVPWHEDPPTAKQMQVLRRFGIDTGTVTCKGHASLLLDRLFTRRHLNLATPKQVRVLRRMGVPDAEMIGFEEARELLSWRLNSRPAA